MTLVIGGLGAGKRAYVMQTLGFHAEDFSRCVNDSCAVLYDLQDMQSPDFDALLQKQVVICNEVGCGVVPISAEARAKREETGRLCIRLAAAADCVVRVQCGIGTVIKGKLPCR